MGYRLLFALGWLWPFVIACSGVAAVATGHPLRGDTAMLLLLAVALLGLPAVVLTIAERMPVGWHPLVQSWAAIVLAVPVMAAELFLAVCLLAYGSNVAGPGWIE